MLTPDEREGMQALVDADKLHLLPIEAHIASVKQLAEKCLELDGEIRFLATPTVPPQMPSLDQLLPDRHKPKLPPPEERPDRRRGSAPMDSTSYDEATMDPTKVGYPPPPKPLTADPRDLP